MMMVNNGDKDDFVYMWHNHIRCCFLGAIFLVEKKNIIQTLSFTFSTA